MVDRAVSRKTSMTAMSVAPEMIRENSTYCRMSIPLSVPVICVTRLSALVNTCSPLSVNQTTAAATTNITPMATDSRNDSFMTDHGSTREIASRTRRGAPCGPTVGMRPVLGRAPVRFSVEVAVRGALELAAGAAVGVVVMVGSLGGRGRVAAANAADVATPAFLSQTVAVSTATIIGDGESSSSPTVAVVVSRSCGDIAVAVAPAAPAAPAAPEGSADPLLDARSADPLLADRSDEPLLAARSAEPLLADRSGAGRLVLVRSGAGRVDESER